LEKEVSVVPNERKSVAEIELPAMCCFI